MTFVNVKPARRFRRRPTFFTDFDRLFAELAKGDAPVRNRPAANVSENNDGFTVELATPGLAKEALIIKVDNDILSISAEKETTEDTKVRNSTFDYSNFKRTFQLPDTVDAAGISASYENGILSVFIPKKEEAKPLPARTIEIN